MQIYTYSLWQRTNLIWTRTTPTIRYFPLVWETRMLQTRSLPFVQTIQRRFIFCQSIIAFRLVKIRRRRPNCQSCAKIDFKFATCQTSLAGIFWQNLLKFSSKREKIFCSFYYQSNDSAQRLEMPQNCDKPVSSSHFAIQLHTVFAARW